METKDIRRKNLELLVKKEGGAAALAKKVDTNPDYISQISSSKSKRNCGPTLARKIEGALGLTRGWMDTPQFVTVEKNDAIPFNESPKVVLEEIPTQKIKKIPIIEWKQAKEGRSIFQEISDNTPHFFRDGNFSPFTFALQVKNNLMVSSHISRNIYPGDIIIIDTIKKPKNNSFIIASLPHYPEAILRQYIEDGGLYYLQPTMTHDKIKIIGVVTEIITALD